MTYGNNEFLIDLSRWSTATRVMAEKLKAVGVPPAEICSLLLERASHFPEGEPPISLFRATIYLCDVLLDKECGQHPHHLAKEAFKNPARRIRDGKLRSKIPMLNTYADVIKYWWPRYQRNGWSWAGYSSFIRDRSATWPCQSPEAPQSLDRALLDFIAVEETETNDSPRLGAAYRTFRYCNTPEDEV